jgi:hypothetical protein
MLCLFIFFNQKIVLSGGDSSLIPSIHACLCLSSMHEQVTGDESDLRSYMQLNQESIRA